MAKARDIYGNITEVGDSFTSGLNPDLIKGKIQVPETTPLGTITSSDLVSRPDLGFQQPPQDTTNYNAMLAGFQAERDALSKALTENKSTDSGLTDLFNKYLFSAQPPPSLAETYKTDFAASGLEEKQKRMASLNAQLAAINAEQKAIPLKLQEEATGRGITREGLAPLEAGELRKLAIRALPIQAESLAVQGEVQLAQDRLNQLFQLKTKDTENLYNYWKDLREKAFDIADNAQKAKLAQQQKEDDRKYQLYRDTITDASQKGNALLATQPDLAAKIYARIGQSTGINDASLASDVATLVGQAKPIKEVGIVTPSPYVPGTNPAVDNWARLIIAGQAKITDVPNPRGSTMRTDVTNAIASSGQLLLSDKDREKLSTLDTAFNVANTIKGLSEKINIFGVGGRVTGYLSRYLGGATQYNTDIARFDAAREGFVSNVARTLGEKGTLAEGDVRRAIANLPTRNDTKDVAEGKLKTLFSILEGTRNSIIQKSTEPLTSVTSGTLGGTVIQGGSGVTTPETLRAKYNY